MNLILNKKILNEGQIWDNTKQFFNKEVLGKTKDNGYTLDKDGNYTYDKANDVNFHKQFQAPEVPEHMENHSLGVVTENEIIKKALPVAVPGAAIAGAGTMVYNHTSTPDYETSQRMAEMDKDMFLSNIDKNNTPEQAALLKERLMLNTVENPFDSINEGSTMQVQYKINKQMLLQEARNPKTGAGSTLEDVEIKTSASPFFEMASNKTGNNKDGDSFGSVSALFTKALKKPVEDKLDAAEEAQRKLKEVQTRMVD